MFTIHKTIVRIRETFLLNTNLLNRSIHSIITKISGENREKSAEELLLPGQTSRKDFECVLHPCLAPRLLQPIG